MQNKTTMSLLLAGLLGATTAWAGTPSDATTDVPAGGQASTMTQGRPNMATTNEPAVESSTSTPARAPMASDASSTGTMGAAPALSSDTPSYGTSNSAIVEAPSTTSHAGALDAPSATSMGAAPVPQDHMRRSRYNSDPRLATGEASTMVNGQPNANPDDPLLSTTAEERRAEREFKRADARTQREQATMGQRGAPDTWRQRGGTPE